MRDRVKRRGRLLVGGSVLALALVIAVAVASTAGASPSVDSGVHQFALPASGLGPGQDATTSNCPATKSPSGCYWRLFFESEQTTASATSVDASAANSTYNDASQLNGGTVPAGTCVDSWLLQWDPGTQPAPLQQDGTVTFQTQILGVDVSSSSLDATDSTFGKSGYSGYPTGTAPSRGFELGTDGLGGSSNNQSGNPDTFGIDATGTQLHVHGDAGTTPAATDYDQIRVLTACVPTTTAAGIAPRLISYNGSSGELETLKATVAQNGVDNGPLTGGIVDFSIDGNPVGSAFIKSTATGASVASLKYTLPPSLVPGYHTITVSYEGAAPEYGASSQTRTFLIKDPTSLN